MAKTKNKPRGGNGRPRRERAKQGFLPDMAPPSHKDIDSAADEYREARGERMRWNKLEGEKADVLLAKMREHDLTTYTTPEGYIVSVDELRKVKVRRPKGESNGEE
jgi:hypothetical protein